jgi:hypothetical protein
LLVQRWLALGFAIDDGGGTMSAAVRAPVLRSTKANDWMDVITRRPLSVVGGARNRGAGRAVFVARKRRCRPHSQRLTGQLGSADWRRHAKQKLDKMLMRPPASSRDTATQSVVVVFGVGRPPRTQARTHAHLSHPLTRTHSRPPTQLASHGGWRGASLESRAHAHRADATAASARLTVSINSSA